MAKPAGALCNMNCSYCFFLHKQDLTGSKFIMSDEILEQFIKSYISSQQTDVVTFTWQGGEPTLAGLDFFKKAVKLQEKYGQGRYIENDLQTNGLLLDDEWSKFLKDNNFLVGISIDGPAEIHDLHRKDKSGNPTHKKVMRAIELLHRYEIPFNALAAVNHDSAKQPLEVYRFLRDQAGTKHIQFLPVVEPADFAVTAPAYWDMSSLPVAGTARVNPGNSGSFVTPWSVNAEDYGNFLKIIFDEWHINDTGNVFIYLFECMVGIWSGQKSILCNLAAGCGNALALDCDGSVYFCDRFVYPDYFIGNVLQSPLEQIASSPDNLLFGKLKSAVPRECKRCQWSFACHGDCPKNRFLKTSNGEPGLNYLCPGLKIFFTHADPYLRDMARQINEMKGG